MLKRYFILSKLGLYQEWKISSTLEKSINVFYHDNILMEKNHVFNSIDAKKFCNISPSRKAIKLFQPNECYPQTKIKQQEKPNTKADCNKHDI